MNLRVYSKLHIFVENKNVEKNDWIVIRNEFEKAIWSLNFKVNGIDECKLNLTYITYDELLEGKIDMKFDYIVGNPPYQDGTQGGGQNKIYNQISKNCLELLADDGTINFITPTSVLKNSKRFSVVGERGLKSVDFTVNEQFNVGVNVCSWVIDRTYKGDIKVITKQGKDLIAEGKVIYDYSLIDKSFSELYETLKDVTDTPIKRMFRQNNCLASKIKTTEYKYPVYKTDKERNIVLTCYVKKTPYHHGENKFIISMTKSFDEKSVNIDEKDFDAGSLCIGVSSKQEIENIKSFLFSDYFKQHSMDWKNTDGYGFNYALKYLPPFDTSVSWDSESVKEFLEGFL